MTMAIDTSKQSTTHSFLSRIATVNPSSVLDAYGRWAVLRGAIADTEVSTSDDELRALMRAEEITLQQIIPLRPRSFDELAAKMEALLFMLDEAPVSHDLRLLGHALAVDIRSWAGAC